jgi:hypothetical protein
MKNPKDFPKALWAVTIAEIAVFTVTGAVIYHYTGWMLARHSVRLLADKLLPQAWNM